ncbi:unnamed protein product [Prunus armeniaca]|uniref:Zinc knuckle CX2CX4HX4C domain-containing protein n=1 Tax=Prunus armeniaca TaxID=36596 RepID=A0A6J5WFT3_PRUAR|nr:hypothetical protein GBA52_008594 [Prunus armeniaca]CAB4298915.1 unnamed protein product [Prunus armeniaca]
MALFVNIRVRVVVDISKPLARGVMINSGGAKHWIRFKYDRLPVFCARFGLLGHEARSCLTKIFGCGIQYSNDLRLSLYLKGTLTVYQRALQIFLMALGEVVGSNSLNAVMVVGEYRWKNGVLVKKH